ncbi:MAG: S41 family peptidase [Candidatus Sericytochromatia bacterium]|nr:S41 family peptidase [Candidatus Sericytochromatia bacterium]
MKFSQLKKTALLSALMAASFAAGVTLQPVLAESGGFRVFLEVYDLVKMEYVEKKVDDQKLVKGAIDGMLSMLDDPYTRYIAPDEFKQMNEEREGSFSGIGIQIGTRDNKLTVIAPIEDTPAWRAGLKAGDWIKAIDGKNTETMVVDDAVKLIRGKEGTAIKLLIYREDSKKTLDISVTRGKIENKVVKYKMIKNNIGYLRLTTFMQNNSPEEMKNAINELKKQGMSALIFDIRSNPGGLLPNAVDIGSLFVSEGPIVRIVDRDGKEEKLNASGRIALDKNTPMAVLIDGGSASASEIVAGTLKDNQRAILIGTRTFGKGLVQTVHNLSNGSGIAITTNKYLTTKGTDINKKGIDPDVLVTVPKEVLDKPYSESLDVQLQKAIELMSERIAAK